MRNSATDNPDFIDRAERQAVDIEATIIGPGGEATDARICSYSPGGFGGFASAVAAIGSYVTVTAKPLGRVPAQVRWALGNRFGAKFLD